MGFERIWSSVASEGLDFVLLEILSFISTPSSSPPLFSSLELTSGTILMTSSLAGA
jgi:hypothetical protein